MLSPTEPSIPSQEKRVHIYGGREASHRLDIIIVGCGLGGIAAAHCLAQAGHNITILEAAREIGEIGAGINVPPNVSRLLTRWGASDALRTAGVFAKGTTQLRYDSGEKISFMPFGERSEKMFGAPHLYLHRADFHKILSDLALSSSRVNLRTHSAVTSINPTPDINSHVSVTLASGGVISGDMIIGADGIKSVTRPIVVGHAAPPEPTGDAAYRIVLSKEVISGDPELRELMESNELFVWLGDGVHCVTYPISAGRHYNIALIHPDDDAIESWVARGEANKMREQFSKFEPRVQKLMSFIEDPLKWKLMDHKPLESWVHPDGRVVLLGDACHPMLPYVAQGAAMAIEDAAVLGNLLSHLSSPSQISYFLNAYERIRLPRASDLQLSSRAVQQMRDNALLTVMPAELDKGTSQIIASGGSQASAGGDTPSVNADQRTPPSSVPSAPNEEKYASWFGYDADAQVDAWWAEEGHTYVEGALNAAG